MMAEPVDLETEVLDSGVPAPVNRSFGTNGTSVAAQSVECAEAEGADRGTRDRVSREILQRGPVTASDLAATLGLTPAAVRRHLDVLTSQHLVSTWTGTEGGPRRRGRPARRFVLTDAGHAAMSTAYDDLAAQLLEFLADTAGAEAVRDFAAVRAGRLAARYRPAVNAVGTDPHQRADALAEALSADGYAASVRSVEDRQLPEHAPAGKQLCQGHCPVQQVATQFPQLCEAETQAFSELLGVHVQRLATLAHGEHVCTTHIPLAHVRAGPNAGPKPESSTKPEVTNVTRGEVSR
jgi:predicted ArsR family transcriptional regulator